MRLFYNYNSHCVRPTAVPQTTISASATLFNGCQITPCGLCSEGPLYFKTLQELLKQQGHSTQLLCSNFLSSSVFHHQPSCDCLLCGDTCFFSSVFILFFFPSSTPFRLSFYISAQQSLCLACFHTPFSMLAPGIPTVENSVCFIWVWKQCANIACLYPLGGIMAAISH